MKLKYTLACLGFCLMSLGACITTPNPQPSPLASLNPTIMPTQTSSPSLQPSTSPSPSAGLLPLPTISTSPSDGWPDIKNYPIQRVAGNGQEGSQDGPALQASFQQFGKPCVDPKDGTMYIPDLNKLRKLTPDGQVSTLAGSDEKGYQDGIGSEARFDRIRACAVDLQGDILVTDVKNHRIRKVTPKGEVSTFLGTGEEKFQDGDAKQVAFNLPIDILSLSSGELYITDAFKLKLFQNNKLETLNKAQTLEANSFRDYSQNQPIQTADYLFGYGFSITVDRQKNIYSFDTQTKRLTKISPQGQTSALNDPNDPWKAGDAFSFAWGAAYDDLRSVLWVANSHVYKIGSKGIFKIVIVNRPDPITKQYPINSLTQGSLIMGADHNLYFTSDTSHQVFRIVLPSAEGFDELS